MSKRSDKLFHLVVSAFALTLTVVSIVTVEYQRDPARVPSWLRPLGNTLPTQHNNGYDGNAAMPVNTAMNTGNQTPDSPANDVGNATSYRPGQPMTVNVSAYGKDVAAAQVDLVKRLLSQYQMASLIPSSLQLNVKSPVQIDLAQNASDYKSVLSSLGVNTSDAQRFTADTGGFTQGHTIVIPLYQNKTQADLANTIAHELTHVVLNEGVDRPVPSWVNEGLAVNIGMHFQKQVDNSINYEGYAKQLAETVVQAAKDGKLVPLASDENKVLAGNSAYDLELQDWLAVSWLLQHHGWSAFDKYLQELNAGSASVDAFDVSFGETPDAVNSTMATLFKSAAEWRDTGVALQFQVSQFQGYVRILQHDTLTWGGFRLHSGTNVCTVSPDGTVEATSNVELTRDSNPPDETTTYVDLDPDQPLTYQGKPVDNCGFAIDYHDGMYGFVNGWVTWKDGKSTYLQDPSLFGVQLTQVKGNGASNPISGLLDTSMANH